jgi:hypothetical protein
MTPRYESPSCVPCSSPRPLRPAACRCSTWSISDSVCPKHPLLANCNPFHVLHIKNGTTIHHDAWVQNTLLILDSSFSPTPCTQPPSSPRHPSVYRLSPSPPPTGSPPSHLIFLPPILPYFIWSFSTPDHDTDDVTYSLPNHLSTLLAWFWVQLHFCLTSPLMPQPT